MFSLLSLLTSQLRAMMRTERSSSAGPRDQCLVTGHIHLVLLTLPRLGPCVALAWNSGHYTRDGHAYESQALSQLQRS